jgi:CDP-diacylglycerol--glycerol-3-phosphate 3-phosphatidyltransferase
MLQYRESSSDFFRWMAIIIFFFAFASDSLDGMIARFRNQKSVLGSFLDPLADKLLVLTAVILLSLRMGGMEKLPSWFPVLVISRDVMIVVGVLLIHIIAGKVTPTPSRAGKFTTFFQLLTVIWILLKVPLYLLPMLCAAALTVVSGVEYIFLGMNQLHNKVASGE